MRAFRSCRSDRDLVIATLAKLQEGARHADMGKDPREHRGEARCYGGNTPGFPSVFLSSNLMHFNRNLFRWFRN